MFIFNVDPTWWHDSLETLCLKPLARYTHTQHMTSDDANLCRYATASHNEEGAVNMLWQAGIIKCITDNLSIIFLRLMSVTVLMCFVV